jgi:hypothetical protein
MSISRRRPCDAAFLSPRSDAASRVLRDQPDVVRETIATKIVDAIRRGERDPSRLRDIALAATRRILWGGSTAFLV